VDVRGEGAEEGGEVDNCESGLREGGGGGSKRQRDRGQREY